MYKVSIFAIKACEERYQKPLEIGIYSVYLSSTFQTLSPLMQYCNTVDRPFRNPNFLLLKKLLSRKWFKM